jgi:hypothetical protein
MEIDKKIGEINPRYRDQGDYKKTGKIKPVAVWEHQIIFDSTSEQLEPRYFWVLDYLREKQGLKVEKLEDNFAAAPGGGYFSEIGAKATKMQEEGMKLMGTINTLIRTIINLLYDLKDFEIRMKQYEGLKNPKKELAQAALLSLKNVWLDKVDMPQRGRGSIHQMTYELGFTTLRDAFLAADKIKDVDKIDLNDRVKRVLKPRLAEFYAWLERSEQERKKRFEIEKAYLRSEVSALKLYTRWAKPYLRIAEELRMRAGDGAGKRITDPELVNAFNTMVMDVKIMGTKQFKPDALAKSKDIPREFEHEKFKRDYFGVEIVQFHFRGLPFRTPQGHYVFGGRMELTFKGYSLNSEELQFLRQEIEKDDLGSALKLVEDVTEKSLEQMQEDLDHFLKEEPPKEKKEKKKTKIKLEDIKKDNFKEGIFRKYIDQKVAKLIFKTYKHYKSNYGLVSYEEPEWDTDAAKSWHNRPQP